MSYVSIDIETTGLNPDICQILEIGAVIDNGGAIDNLPIFRCLIDNGIITGEPYALWLNNELIKSLSLEHLHAIKPKYVASAFLSFLRENGIENGFTIAGKNYANFDANFLKHIPKWSDLIIHSHSIINPGNLYWDYSVDGYKLPNSSKCLERAGLSNYVAHTAVEDAKSVIKLVRNYVKNRSNKSIS